MADRGDEKTRGRGFARSTRRRRSGGRQAVRARARRQATRQRCGGRSSRPLRKRPPNSPSTSEAVSASALDGAWSERAADRACRIRGRSTNDPRPEPPVHTNYRPRTCRRRNVQVRARQSFRGSMGRARAPSRARRSGNSAISSAAAWTSPEYECRMSTRTGRPGPADRVYGAIRKSRSRNSVRQASATARSYRLPAPRSISSRALSSP